MSDQFGFLEGAKSLSDSLDASRAGAKELSKSIENVQKEATDVAIRKAQERKRQQREAEFLKERAIIKALDEYRRRKKISDEEYSTLVKATHAEADGGKGNQQEQAMIMASILNRARTHKGGIMGALYQKNQFQAVTGTAADGNRPSKQFVEGPGADRLKQLEGATNMLENISTEQKNFTAARAGAYGPGTNIGYRNNMLQQGGQVIGGTVFQTTMSGRQGVNTPDASQAVGSRGAPSNGEVKAQAMDQAQQEFLANQVRLQEEANDIARRQLQTQQKTLSASR
jgi:hypothetical protein